MLKSLQLKHLHAKITVHFVNKLFNVYVFSCFLALTYSQWLNIVAASILIVFICSKQTKKNRKTNHIAKHPTCFADTANVEQKVHALNRLVCEAFIGKVHKKLQKIALRHDLLVDCMNHTNFMHACQELIFVQKHVTLVLMDKFSPVAWQHF